MFRACRDGFASMFRCRAPPTTTLRSRAVFGVLRAVFRVCRRSAWSSHCSSAGYDVAPAWACGCGATSPTGRRSSTTRAGRGTARGHLMSAPHRSSDSAAWVMPVPSAARISLGDTEAFDRTRQAHGSTHRVPRLVVADVHAGCPRANSPTEPRQALPPGAGVNVLGRQRIGAVRCHAAGRHRTRPRWRSGWRTTDFHIPTGSTRTLRRYVADRWEIVAVTARARRTQASR